MNSAKPIASLSLDLDNKWSYMKTHGDSGWETFPTYLETVVPRSLAFFKERDLTITFFIVGQDAALEKNREALAQIPAAGHEIGNHSFNHEPWLHLYSREQLSEEFEKAEAAIESATGVRPAGFRGPGFSLSATVEDVLAERGYKYDCSKFPTYIGPLARAYYFLRSPKMTEEEREKRKKLFGSFGDGFTTLKPHELNVNGRKLMEVPVTTFPAVKTPIHFSYLLYLACFSEAAARLYFNAALRSCKLTGVEPSMLLHPLDFLDGGDAPELEFFPAMNMDHLKKIELLNEFVGRLTRDFETVTLGEHAEIAGKRGRPLTSTDPAAVE